MVSLWGREEEEELGFEVGFFRTGGGDALLLPSSPSEVASDEVLKTGQQGSTAPVGHPWDCLGRGSRV